MSEDKPPPDNPFEVSSGIVNDAPDTCERPVTAETVFNPDGTIKETEVVEKKDHKINFHVPNILPAIKHIVRKKEIPREVTLYAVFSDANGELDKIMNFLHIEKPQEKKIWFIMWEDIIGGEKSKGMTYSHFTNFFNIEADDFAKRVFDMIDAGFSGVVSLVDFMKFCAKYLLIDRYLSEEFAFRIMLRRAGAFQRNHSILDLEDVKFFFTYRYKFKSVKQKNRRAFDFFQYVDADGDGGLDVNEYQNFAKNNYSVGMFGHIVLQHMRKVCFGVKYWVEKSRKIAYANRSTLNFTSLKRVNIRSEQYCEDLLEAVVDKDGKPLTSEFDAQIAFYSQDKIIEATAAEIAKAAAQRRKILNRVVKPRLTISRLERRDFVNDFPEIETKRLERKQAKLDEVDKLNRLANGLASKTYRLMIKVCGDLVHGRRPLRMAFEKWKNVLGIGTITADNSKLHTPAITRLNSVEVEALSKEERKAYELKLALKDQVGKKKGMQAVIERELELVGDGMQDDDAIYNDILKAAETRQAEAKENIMNRYFDDYLEQLHGDLMHEDRTRSLAANCKIFPPVPPAKLQSVSKMRKRKSKRKQK